MVWRWLSLLPDKAQAWNSLVRPRLDVANERAWRELVFVVRNDFDGVGCFPDRSFHGVGLVANLTTTGAQERHGHDY